MTQLWHYLLKLLNDISRRSTKLRMTLSKIIPESKQKNKPMNSPPLLIPEIIPESLRLLLNSPKPTLNTVPRSESYVNKIQLQTVKR